MSQRQLSTGDGGNMRGEDLSVGAPEKWNGKEWLILDEKAGRDVYRYYIDSATALMWRTKAMRADGTIPYECVIEKLRVTSRRKTEPARR